MGSSKACWQGPVLRHLAGFTAFGKGFYARRNCENAGMAAFLRHSTIVVCHLLRLTRVKRRLFSFSKAIGVSTLYP
jgi:hypothetical protein